MVITTVRFSPYIFLAAFNIEIYTLKKFQLSEFFFIADNNEKNHVNMCSRKIFMFYKIQFFFIHPKIFLASFLSANAYIIKNITMKYNNHFLFHHVHFNIYSIHKNDDYSKNLAQ